MPGRRIGTVLGVLEGSPGGHCMWGGESQGHVVGDGAVEASRNQILSPCGTGSYLQLLSTGD